MGGFRGRTSEESEQPGHTAYLQTAGSPDTQEKMWWGSGDWGVGFPVPDSRIPAEADIKVIIK